MKKNKLIKDYPLSDTNIWEDKSTNLKLDWNESDEKIPDKFLKEAFDVYRKERNNWYPNPKNQKLLKTIKDYTKTNIENIFYSNGSDTVHEYILTTLINEGDNVLILSPNYDQFRKAAHLNKASIKFFNFLNNKSSINWLEINSYILKNKPKLVYLSNPNNPTGLVFDKIKLSQLIGKHKKTFFLVDEAYGEFTNHSVLKYINKHKNLIITKSLSKAFGAASIRFGYIIANKKTIDLYKKVANAKNTTLFSQILANILIKNRKYIKKRITIINKNKQIIYKELLRLKLLFFNSECNFILINFENSKRKKKILHIFKNESIFIRDMSHISGYKNYARITIGSSNKFNKLIDLLKKLKDI